MSTVADVAVAALRAAGLRTGDAVARTDAGADLTPPYVVVWPFSRTNDGPGTAPDADRAHVIQVTAVGRTRGSAENIAATAETVLKGALPAPTGYVWAGPVTHELSRGVQRDDAVDPPLFWAVDHYRFPLTPA